MLDSITVPASYGAHRFWRNTSVATLTSGQIATFAPGTLGYEWNEACTTRAQPPGLMRLSSATVSNVSRIQDYGNNFPSGQQATHSLTLYRHSSGALVFSAGTVQWSWGLDDVHDGSGSSSASSSSSPSSLVRPIRVHWLRQLPAQPLRPKRERFASITRKAAQTRACSTAQQLHRTSGESLSTASVQSYQSSAADDRMHQATVNLFADMGVQPASLQAGLIPATQSTDATAPTSAIQSPLTGATIQTGSQVT